MTKVTAPIIAAVIAAIAAIIVALISSHGSSSSSDLGNHCPANHGSTSTCIING
jgi:hypothetical protein